MNAAVLLDTNILSNEEIRKINAAQQKFNTMRFEAGGGGGSENQIGYILFKDGVDVRAGGYVRNTGKMTLGEALAEYERYLRVENATVQSRADISEIIHEGAVIGYIVISQRVDFDLWEDTSQKNPSKIVLILYYADTYDTN